MDEMVRILVYDRTDAYVCEIDPAQVLAMDYVDALNGEHSLTITTTQLLDKTNRLVVRDGTGEWREYVVLGATDTHDTAGPVQCEYYCVWSLQYDLSATFINNEYGCGVVPGHASVPQTAWTALSVALEGTRRWDIGRVSVTTMASASFYRRSGWDGLKTVIERWGGELHATIEVGTNGVEYRAVDLLSHTGANTPTRRFDFGADVTAIQRIVSDDVWPCRIVPLGKSQETEAGGYTRRPSIESVNDGVMWLQDDDVVEQTRVPDGHGGWEYPTSIIENDTYEDPADLLAWARAHISEYTRPKVSYKANVAQFVRAGLDPQGVELGDEVIVVDRDFGGDGLRISARVVKIAGSVLDPADTTLTIGNMSETLGGQMSDLTRQVSRLDESASSVASYQSTADYLSNLLDRINEQVNATGGYTYITEGQGIRTYDRAVSDPLVGAEATQVTEQKGGTIRIASSKDAAGNWIWRTVFESGHIASELITAINVVAGFIGSAESGNYWNLDTGELHIGAFNELQESAITRVDVEFAQNASNTVAPTTGWQTVAPTWRSGQYIWQRTATTTASGTTYSSPTCISGREGTDGTSVTILGSYDTLAQLEAAHPTGSTGDSYMVDGDLYVWDGSAWRDVGKIQGPSGADGTSVTVTSIQYSTSASASTEPISWSQASPTSPAKGTWLWTRTTYSTGAIVTTKSYVGTDGTNGTNGTNGKDGEDGVGIRSIVEQYYLSTSDTAQTGGTWGTEQPAWSSGRHIWTRTLITWDTTPATTTTTAPVLAKAINGANSTASTAKGTADAAKSTADTAKSTADTARAEAADAAKVATNYLSFSGASGLDVGYSGTSAKTRVNGSGVEVFDGSGVSALYAGTQGGSSVVRVGRASGSGNVVMSSDGYVDVRNASTVMAHFGYGSGKGESGGSSVAPYYDIGIREGGKTVGNYSVVEGNHNEAGGYCSHAEGLYASATGNSAHAEGYRTKASGAFSHAEGYYSSASGSYSHADGCGTIAAYAGQHVCGWYNLSGYSNDLFVVGYGSSDSGRANVFTAHTDGGLWCAGTLTQNSDRRLKEHHAYLGEDAADFVRNLRPALYTKDGRRHVGFYAQDVQEAEPEGWETCTVESRHTNEALGFDPLTLDYSALIAPLVAYAQTLERRIEALETQAEGNLRTEDA